MANGKFAIKRNLPHDAFQQRSFTLTISTNKSYFLATLDGKVYSTEYHMLIITFGSILTDHGIITTTQGTFKLQSKGRVVHLVHFYRDNFLQLFDSALHLNGFCGLIAKAVYKGFYILYLLLLVFVGTQLLLSPFCTQHHIFIILNLIIIYLPTTDFKRSVGNIIYKSTVMTHQHHSSCACAQELLQPLDALYVKMVGRLVQQQHIRVLQQ